MDLMLLYTTRPKPKRETEQHNPVTTFHTQPINTFVYLRPWRFTSVARRLTSSKIRWEVPPKASLLHTPDKPQPQHLWGFIHWSLPPFLAKLVTDTPQETPKETTDSKEKFAALKQDLEILSSLSFPSSQMRAGNTRAPTTNSTAFSSLIQNL